MVEAREGRQTTVTMAITTGAVVAASTSNTRLLTSKNPSDPEAEAPGAEGDATPPPWTSIWVAAVAEATSLAPTNLNLEATEAAQEVLASALPIAAVAVVATLVLVVVVASEEDQVVDIGEEVTTPKEEEAEEEDTTITRSNRVALPLAEALAEAAAGASEAGVVVVAVALLAQASLCQPVASS